MCAKINYIQCYILLYLQIFSSSRKILKLRDINFWQLLIYISIAISI